MPVQSTRVLLVDDDEDDYILMRDLFSEIEHASFQLEWVSSYEKALEIIPQQKHDVYLIDYYLGANDGLELMKNILRHGCQKPMILLTGLGDHDVDVRAMKTGAADYLVKGQISSILMERAIRYAIERKRTESELTRLATVIEHATESVIITDRDGRIEYVNPAFAHTSGLKPENVLNTSLDAILGKSSMESSPPNSWKSLQKGEVWKGDLKSTRPDGREHVEEGTIFPIQDKNGNTLHFAVLKRDVTHERQLEEQMRHAKKMEAVGQLAGGIAHDFNNLLAVILGYTSLIMKQLGEENPVQKKLESIRTAGQKASQITRQLLAFSRKQLLQPRVVSLNAHLQEITQMIKGLINESIEFTPLFSEHDLRIKIDPNYLDQAIINLVLNARDAMPNGGRLILKTESRTIASPTHLAHENIPPGEYAQLSIEDTGTGIPPEIRQHIFEPFFTTKATDKGSGLGLSTTYGIVRQSSGYIDLQSNPGQGTTFTIYLPIVVESAEKLIRTVSDAKSMKGSETILVVEDQSPVMDMAREILEAQGYHVICANTTKEALQICKDPDRKIDLLFTDIVMPAMSGIELANHFHEHKPQTKVLFTSGYAEHATLQRGLLNPAVNFLAKPYDILSLSQKLRSLLESKS